MTHRRTTHSTKRRSLHAYMQMVLRRGKRNQHHGDKRDADLQAELRRVEKRVAQTLANINKQAANGSSPDDDRKIRMKLDKTTDVLTNDLMRLTAVYHRQRDVLAIQRFLDDQKEALRMAVIGSNIPEDDDTRSLDDRVRELHQLMHDERLRVRRSNKREQIKFLLGIIIGLLSLAISIYALLMR